MSVPPAPVQDGEKSQEPLQRSLNFIDLPVEILSNIFTLLLPHGIVTLGKCCRFLHNVSKERQIWSSALKVAFTENKIFSPTYPLAAMSTEELKAACTRPWKFRRQIWNGQGLLEPTRVQILLPYSGAAVQQMELIPGGRFLLTTDARQRLCLWDLGYRTDTVLTQEPLALKTFSRPGVWGKTRLLVNPTTDGRGVVCGVLLSPDWSDSPTEVHIIEVYPTSDRPRFNTIAAYQLAEQDRGSLCYTMSCNLFFYHTISHLVLWDFRRNARCQYFCLGKAEKILIHDNILLVLKANTYLIFSIPTLLISRNVVIKISPMEDGNFLSDALEFRTPLPWYTAAPVPAHSNQKNVVIDATRLNEKGERRIQLLSLSTSVVQSGSSSAMLRLTHDEPDDIHKDSNSKMTCFAMSGGDHAIVWLDGRLMRLRVTRGLCPGGTTHRLLYEAHTGEIDLDEWTWSFCPFAGRVCSLSLRGEVRIIDFVR